MTSNTFNSAPVLVLTALFSALVSLPTIAKPGAKHWRFQAGGAAIVTQTPWHDADIQAAVVPFINAEYGDWSFGFENGLVNYRFIHKPDWSFAASLDFRDETFDSDMSFSNDVSNAAIYQGYEDKEGELAARLHANYQNWSAVFAQDISDQSGGATLEIDFDYPLWVGQHGERIVLNTGVRLLSEDYAQHLYGVDTAQVDVSVGRTTYQAETAVNWNVGFTALYPLAEQWMMISKVQYEQLDQTIQDSPLVEQSGQSSLMAILSYQF